MRLKAAESILDRAGIVAEQKVEVDNQVTITVSYEDVELAKHVIEAMPQALDAPRNGHENAPHLEGHGNGREPEG